jgi:hypothetical protein
LKKAVEVREAVKAAGSVYPVKNLKKACKKALVNFRNKI